MKRVSHGKYQKQLHGCSAEGHVSHLYSARLSSRPLGWKTINVDNIIPVMEFGTTEQRKFFKQLLEYKRAV